MTVVSLTQADNGRSIEVQQRDEIAVRLPENPTTGYRWHVDRVEGGVGLIDDSFELGTSQQIGGGGVREFRFRFHGPDRGRIELKHWQQWEGEASVTERFTVEVVPLP